MLEGPIPAAEKTLSRLLLRGLDLERPIKGHTRLDVMIFIHTTPVKITPSGSVRAVGIFSLNEAPYSSRRRL